MVGIGSWAARFENKHTLWLSDFNFGGLYKYDLRNKALSLETYFENGNLVGEQLHKKMVIRDDNIFLFPLADSVIRVYNIKDKTSAKIQLPKSRNQNQFSVGDDHWFLLDGECYKFNYDNRELEKDDACSKLLIDTLALNKKKVRFKTGDALTAFDKEEKKVYKFSPDCLDYDVVSLCSISESIEDVFYLKGKYWILHSYIHDVMSRDEKDDKYDLFTAEESEYVKEGKSIPYSGIYLIGDKLILPNYYGKHFMNINEKKGTVLRLFDDTTEEGITDILDYGACYYTVLEQDGYVYCIPQRAKWILKCDRSLNLVEQYPMEIRVGSSFVDKVLKLKKNKQQIVLNEGLFNIGLREYIGYLYE